MLSAAGNGFATHPQPSHKASLVFIGGCVYDVINTLIK